MLKCIKAELHKKKDFYPISWIVNSRMITWEAVKIGGPGILSCMASPMAEEQASLSDSTFSDSESAVTLRDGRAAIKAVVDEIFSRLVSAAREWPGVYAVESLAGVALGFGDASITDPSLTKLLYKHRLITTPDIPVRREQIAGGADGLTASIVGSSFCWERGDIRLVCPYR